MAKIISITEIEKEIQAIKKEGKTIVLCGGCFDILHVGHVKFLQEAKKFGDYLIVMLESDETVKKLKGTNRPYFPQKERAKVLSSLRFVDYVILMKPLHSDEEYNNLVLQISPDIIAVTENDLHLFKKEKQAKRVSGKIKIIPFIKTFSSSKLANLIGID